MKVTFLCPVVALAFVISGCVQSPPSEPSATPNGVAPIHLTDANFQAEVIESDVPVLVDMWAPWCQPCITMTPIIRKVTEALKTTARVGELNIEENAFIKQKYNIDKYPMLLIFVDGEEVQRLVGMNTYDELVAVMSTYVSIPQR